MGEFGVRLNEEIEIEPVPAYLQRGHSLDEYRQWGAKDPWTYPLEVGVIVGVCTFIAALSPYLVPIVAAVGILLFWLVDTSWDNDKPIKEQHPRQIRRFMKDQEHRLRMERSIARIAAETMPPLKHPRGHNPPPPAPWLPAKVPPPPPASTNNRGTR